MDFVKEKIREYYAREGVKPPAEFEKREFGFGNDKKIDYRHAAFKTEDDLKKYMVEKVPLYASCSSGYYEFPDARPMQKKNLLGADLVFEFDTECSHGTITCTECMDSAKQETFKLIEQFLIPDFGVKKQEISVNFSGSRGYHVHVTNDAVMGLSGKARKEVVDYVQARDLDTNLSGFTPDSKGWPGRLSGMAYNYIENYEGKASNVGRHIIERREEILDGIRKGNYSSFPRAGLVVRRAIDKQVVRLSSKIDQSVTMDVSRLMRVPDTIHGGSSLLAARVKGLESFNPFKDTVVFYNPPAAMKLLADVNEFTLNDETFGPFKAGQEKSLPEYAAMYLACRGLAKKEG